ncbi:MAG: glycoside hydrolase family 2 TIM barrel-domain containing protein [Streptosporangiaceae bacterium]
MTIRRPLSLGHGAVPRAPGPPEAVPRRAVLAGMGGLGVAAAVPGPAPNHPAMRSARASTETPAPVIHPVPAMVRGVAHPVITLDGRWRFTTDPPRWFWRNEADSAWPEIDVPGEPAMQGFAIERDTEYPYKKRFTVPADFAGRRAVLRFDGVYSHARVWVDGHHVRDHQGGFTSWDADVTPYVTPGSPALLTVGVTDQADAIAWASNYAHHNIGGILRGVRLLALPPEPLTALHVSTDFDRSYTDATLHVTAAVAFADSRQAVVHLTLTDPDGRVVDIEPATIQLTPDRPRATVAIPVRGPAKWNVEHPRRYTLTARLIARGPRETVTKRIGFRQVQVRGNRVVVNGTPVTLHGVDHHQISAHLGRTTSPELDEKDIRLLRAAHVNVIRTSHYPPTPALLDAADEHGMFVEEESAVCFQHGSTPGDPAYRSRYLHQFAEMIERDRDHPSVIIWSLGNESRWDSNFLAEYEYAKAHDPTRPVIMSYPDGGKYDIRSVHYPAWNGSFGSSTLPVFYDEFGHVPCYNVATLRRDPGVRDFWGESIARFRPRFHASRGALGGAIWCGIDDIFELPSRTVGYGEWGILDIWRRRKPEHWLTKKAYSPVRIADEPLGDARPGQDVRVPVDNWYDFTNLRELRIDWRVGDRSGRLRGVDIPPGRHGELVVPVRGWEPGEILHLSFRDRGGGLVDAYRLPLRRATTPTFPGVGGTAPEIHETASRIEVRGVDEPFALTFSKETGQVTMGTHGRTTILTGGPHLNLVGAALGGWTSTAISAEPAPHQAVVTIDGAYGDVRVRFRVAIDGRGLVTTRSTIDNPPEAPAGGFFEVGVGYRLASGIDGLAWRRHGQWSVYPDDHIGRNSGVARRDRPGRASAYRERPDWPWAEDTHDYFLFGKDDEGRWTNDFRAQKTAVYAATASISGKGVGVRAESDGSHAVRLASVPPYVVDDADPRVRYTGSWTHAAGQPWSVGDHGGTESFSDTAGDAAELTFSGSGIRFVGARNANLGTVDVYVDGVLEGDGIDAYAPSKTYQQTLFEKTGLARGTHTIKAVVTGRRNPAATDTYVLVDAFEPLGGPHEGSDEVLFLVNNRWNYPDVDWGNYQKPAITLRSGYTATARMRLTS